MSTSEISRRAESLAYLYVQKKQYDNPSPEELAKDYTDAYESIHQYFTDHREPSKVLC